MLLKIIHQPGTNDFQDFRYEGIPAIGEVRDFAPAVSEKLLRMNLAVKVEELKPAKPEIQSPAFAPELKAVPPEPRLMPDRPSKKNKE